MSNTVNRCMLANKQLKLRVCNQKREKVNYIAVNSLIRRRQRASVVSRAYCDLH